MRKRYNVEPRCHVPISSSSIRLNKHTFVFGSNGEKRSREIVQKVCMRHAHRANAVMFLYTFVYN